MIAGWVVVAVLVVFAALVCWVSYRFELSQIQRVRAFGDTLPVVGLDEAVLLGPVSAWVAEGEARAVRQWEAAISPEEFRAAPQWRPQPTLPNPMREAEWR